MADGPSAACANSMLTAVKSTYVYVQLHTGAPGAAGTANVATESTREAVTWTSPSGGSMQNTADVAWSGVPATETITHFSAWDALTSGNFGFSGTVSNGALTAGEDAKFAAGALTAPVTLAS